MKRGLKNTASVVVVLLVFVATIIAVLLGLVLFTETGTRHALRLGQRWYVRQVAADLQIQNISGTFYKGITLRRVRITDGDERPIITVVRLDLQVELEALLAGTVRVEELVVTGGLVTLRERDGHSSFEDLGFASTEDGAPRVSRKTAVPAIPILLAVERLRVEDTALESALSKGTQRIAQLDRLSLRGTWATFRPEVALRELVGSVHADGETVEVHSLVLSAAIPDGNHLGARAELHTNYGQVGIHGTLELSELVPAQFIYEMQSRLFGDLGSPLDGRVAGGGTITFGLDKNGSPMATARFDCEQCHTDATEDLELELFGTLRGKHVEGRLIAAGTGLKLRASAVAEDFEHVDVDYRLSGAPGRVLREYLQFDKLAVVGEIRGSCALGAAESFCTAEAALKNLSYDKARIASLAGTARLDRSESKMSVRTDLSYRDFSYDQMRIDRGALRLNIADRRIRFFLKGLNKKGEFAEIKGRFAPADKYGTVFVDKLESDLWGVPLAIDRPVKLVIGEEGIASDTGLLLKVGEGTVLLDGHQRSDGSSSLRAEISDLDLGLVGTLVGREEIRGRIDGTALLKGRLSNPRLSLRLAGRDLRYGRTRVSRLELDSSYSGRRLVFELKAENRGKSVMSVNGELPLALNLKTGVVRHLDRKSGFVRWKIEHLSTDMLPPQIGLPEGLLFETKAEGRFEQARDRISMLGTVSGWVQHPLSGRVPFDVSLDLNPDTQQVDLNATGKNNLPVRLALNANYSVQKLLKGIYSTDRYRVDLRVGSGSLIATGTMKDIRNLTTEVAVDSLLLGEIAGYLGDRTVDGSLSANLRARLTKGELTGEFDVEMANMFLDKWSVGKFVLAGSYRDAQVEAGGELSHPHGESVTFEGKFPLQVSLAEGKVRWVRSGEHRLKWDMPAIDVRAIQGLFSIPEQFEMTLGTSGELNGPIEELRSRSFVAGTITAGDDPEVKWNVDIAVDGSGQHLSAAVGAATMELHGRADLPQLLKGEQALAEISWTGKLVMDNFELAPLEVLPLDFLSNISGQTSADLQISGTPQKPVFKGDIFLRNAGFSLTGLADPIRALEADIAVDFRKFDIERLSFLSGGGRAEIEAGIIRSDEEGLRLRMKVETELLPIGIRGLPQVTIDSKSSLVVTASEHLLDVKTVVHSATISRPTEMGSATKSIPANDNVVVAEEISASPPESRASSKDLRVAIDSEKPVQVKAKELDTHWNASLVINRRQGKTSADGKISSTKGRFSIFGNTFDLEKGNLTFGEELDEGAFVDIESSYQHSEATVFLNVSGNILRPKMSLSSSPAMSEEQIVSLLLSGTSESGSEGSGVLSVMLALHYPLVQNFLYNRLGITQFKIGSSQGGGTNVKMGRKVTEKAHVYTAFNPSAGNDENTLELTVETRMARSITLDTTVGDEKSSIGFYWRKTIPNKPVKEKEKD